MKGGARIVWCGYPYLSSHSFNNFFSDSKADTGSGIFLSVVQSLKNDEDLIKKWWLNTYTIVGNYKLEKAVL